MTTLTTTTIMAIVILIGVAIAYSQHKRNRFRKRLVINQRVKVWLQEELSYAPGNICFINTYENPPRIFVKIDGDKNEKRVELKDIFPCKYRHP